MAYIGKQPGTGVRNRFLYTATAGQTTFTTSDSNLALSYSDALYMDVYLNGVLLDPANDYTATSGTSVVLGAGASAGDILEIVVYDVFSVFNNTIDGNFEVGGNLTVDTSTLKVDSANNAVGILTTSPTNASLDVAGRSRFLQDAAATTGAVIIRESSGGVGGHVQFVTNDNSGQRGFIASNSSSDILFGSSAERMRMLSAGGLTFNGDTAAANALDDYEEGTWTPTSANGTLDVQRSNYTKIGRQVNLNCTIRYSTPSTSSDTVSLGGLPFASTADVEFIGTLMLNGQDVTTTSTYSYIYGGSSTDVLTLYQNRDNASVLGIPYNAFGTNEPVYISITYTTS